MEIAKQIINLYIRKGNADYSIEESRAWIESRPEAWEKGTEYDFVIADAKDGFFYGGCGLNHINLATQAPRIANLGYWVRTNRTKRGLASAATRLLAEFGFADLGLNRIEIVIAVGNKASQKVAMKVGAIREGILRNRLLLRGKLHDAIMFSLIPEDMGSSK